MKIVKYLGIALAALLALAIVGAGIARLVINGPIGPVAGGQLDGSQRAAPADWYFTNEHSTIAVEVQPEDPHFARAPDQGPVDGRRHRQRRR